jgi:hypothetical protein
VWFKHGETPGDTVSSVNPHPIRQKGNYLRRVVWALRSSDCVPRLSLHRLGANDWGTAQQQTYQSSSHVVLLVSRALPDETREIGHIGNRTQAVKVTRPFLYCRRIPSLPWHSNTELQSLRQSRTNRCDGRTVLFHTAVKTPMTVRPFGLVEGSRGLPQPRRQQVRVISPWGYPA